MRLISISIENFGGFEKAYLPFPQGLVAISGRNLDMNGSNSNGSGKSCLFDAIAWGLFGKPLRGDGSADIIRKGSPQAMVIIDFEQNGNHYIIQRTKKTSGGQLEFTAGDKDGEVTNFSQSTMAGTQEKIDNVLGMDYKIFRAVATFAEDALRFAGATDKEQKEILERLLCLEAYGEALARVKVDLAKVNTDFQSTEYLVNHETKQVEGLKAQIIKTEAENEAWAAASEVQLASVKAEMQTLDTELVALETTEDFTKVKITEIDIKRASVQYPNQQDLQNAYEKANTAYNKAITNESIVKQEQKTLERAIQAKEKELEQVTSKIGTPCGECRRLITANELSGAQEALATGVLGLYDNLETVKLTVQLAAQAVQGVASGLAEAKNGLAGVRAAYDAANRQIEAFNKEKTTLHNTLETMHLRRRQIDAQKSILERKESQFDTEMTIRENKLNDLKKNLETLKVEMHGAFEKLGQLRKEKEYLEFWVKAYGFGGIRSVLLDGVAEQLTERTNRYLKALTDGSVWVQFSTLSETKGGELRERFEVKVNNAYGAGEYSGNSGGERQRIDLCIALALHWLTRSRASKPLGFSIFDEVFERLDEAGCEAVVNLLRKEQADLGTMFVVSHNPALTMRFPEVINVEKKNGISKIVGGGGGCDDSKPKSVLPKTEKLEKPTRVTGSFETSTPKVTRKKSKDTLKSL